jgi:methyl-accepting chemotaxis protein
MKWIRKITGGLAMLLGSTGVLLCLAAFIGVWMVNHRIQQPVEHLLNQAFSLCDQAADGAGRIAGELDTSRDVVSDMQERLHNALQDALNLTDEDLLRIESLFTDLTVATQQVREWIGLAQASLEFLDQAVDLVSSAVGYVQADASVRSNLSSALNSGAEKVEEAVLLLDQVQLHVLAIQARENPERELAAVESLSTKLDGVLVSLKEKALTVALELTGLGKAIETLQARIQRILLLVSIALSVLLFWQAAAQAALVLLGQKMIQSKPAPPVAIALPAAPPPLPEASTAPQTAKKRHPRAKKHKKRRK